MTGRFKSLRALFWFRPLAFVLSYNNSHAYNIQSKQLVQWRTCWLVMLMTWVRSQVFTLSICFFSINIHVQHKRCGSPYSSKSSMPRVRWEQSKGYRLEEHHKLWSTRQHAPWKVKRASKVIGPELLRPNLHIGVWTPRFAFFYFLHLFCIIIFCK